MSKASSVLLITTATNPPEGVFTLAMTSAAKRKITAKAAALFWSVSGIQKMVIADATGETLLDNSEVILLNQLGIEVEQIHYAQNDELILSRGKGYGEGALIEFAITNSRLLKDVDNFFKCTGKMFCRNFGEIFYMIEQNNIQNIFWKDLFDYRADTRFFYTSKEFYKNFLMPAYRNIDDRKDLTSENLVLKVINENLALGQAVRPLLTGYAGGTNEPCFDLSLGFLDQNLACWVTQ